jgi:hypothetical protein
MSLRGEGPRGGAEDFEVLFDHYVKDIHNCVDFSGSGKRPVCCRPGWALEDEVRNNTLPRFSVHYSQSFLVGQPAPR